MEHIAALLLIVGCSGDLKECNELPAPTPVYETFDECQVEMRITLATMAGQRDKILGQCVYVDPAMEEEDAELVWDVEKNGRLVASIETANPAIAANVDHSLITGSINR
jgi:hypothetical protein